MAHCVLLVFLIHLVSPQSCDPSSGQNCFNPPPVSKGPWFFEKTNAVYQKINTALFSQASSPYDYVIKVDSLRRFGNPGWGLFVRSDEINKTLYEETTARSIIVSTLGLYNRGKTFVTGKLSRKVLPQGYLVHTEGLSFVLPGGPTRFLLLDTAGLSQPVPRM